VLSLSEFKSVVIIVKCCG